MTKWENNKSYYLSPLENTLDEVVFTPNENKDYTILRGFFRSYQTEDAVAKYYSDGIMEYYIPKDENKNIKQNVVEYRVFENKKNQQKKRIVDVSIDNFNLPFLNKKPLSHLENASNALEINYKNNHIILSKDFIIDKTKIFNLLGYRIQMINNIKIEEHNSDNLPITQKELVKSIQYINLNFKHKKDDRYKNIETIYEFYTLEKTFCSNKEFKRKKRKFNTYHKSKSYYTDKYWEKINKNIPPLIKPIENQLYNNLEEN
ncbi:MAG: hypothetical protein ACK5MD_10125 [Flavobacteriales bacterium]